MDRITIYPSLISSDLLNLEKTIRLLEPHCDGFHIDVMDNHFVPNLTWGAPFINALAHITTKPLSIHLMIDNPLPFLETLHLQPKSVAIIHIETKLDMQAFIHYTHKKKIRPSLALRPKTPLNDIFAYLGMIDHVLLMSVEPGFSGQQFMPAACDRLAQLVTYKHDHNKTFTIAMDGGINLKNIGQLVDMGCTEFAIASAIFDSNDPVKAIKELYEAAQH